MKNILFRWLQVRGAGERIMFLTKRKGPSGPYSGWMIDIGHNNDKVFYENILWNLSDDEDIFDENGNIELVNVNKWFDEPYPELKNDMIRALF